MRLTKEKCENSLSNLYYILSHPCDGCDHNETQFCNRCNVKEDLSNIRKLITEHFDNPPLAFEELHEDMWVWDNDFNSFGEYIYIIEVYIDRYNQKIIKALCKGCDEIMTRSYNPTRFYRKQVKIND